MIRFGLIFCTILMYACATENREGTVTSKEKDSIQIDKVDESNYSYFPVDYKENITEILLDTATELRLYIKHHSLMNEGFEVPFDYDNGSDTVFFRDFVADVVITIKEDTVFSKSFQKEFFADKIKV